MFTNVIAIGLPQISLLDDKLQRRKEIFTYYADKISKFEHISIMEPQNVSRSSHYFCTLIAPYRTSLAEYLLSNNIYSTFRYYPLDKLSLFNRSGLEYQGSRFVSENFLNIPIHNGLSDSEVAYIAETIENYAEKQKFIA